MSVENDLRWRIPRSRGTRRAHVMGALLVQPAVSGNFPNHYGAGEWGKASQYTNIGTRYLVK